MDTQSKVDHKLYDDLIKHFIQITTGLLMSAPFERIKIILQTQTIGRTTSHQHYTNFIHYFKHINQKQGLLQLWKGNTINIQKTILQITIIDYFLSDPLKHNHNNLIQSSFKCWLGWTACSLFTHPMDVVRIRMYNDLASISKPKLYKGLLDGFRTIIQTEGIKTLYKGYFLHSIAHVPYFTLSFYLYQQITKHSQHQFTQITNGGLACILTRMIIYPLENMTHRLIINGSNGYYNRYHNTTDCFKKVIHKEGIRGFYSGFMVGVVGLATNMVIQFQTYKSLQQISQL